jgi:hypothetical protein
LQIKGIITSEYYVNILVEKDHNVTIRFNLLNQEDNSMASRRKNEL